MALRVVPTQLEVLEQSGAALQSIAGGATHGQNWYDGKPASMDILEWYGQTLGKVNTQQLEKHMHVASKATIRTCNSVCGIFDVRCVAAELQTEVWG